MLNRLWQENQPVLRSIVRNVLQDPSRIDDVLQDSYTRLLRHRPPEHNLEDSYRFIRRVVLTTSIDHYRRNQRFFDALEAFSSVRKCGEPTPLRRLMSREEEVLRGRLMNEIREIVDELPDMYRLAVDTYYFRSGKSIQQVCEERGLPYSTLRSRMLSGVRRIRIRLRKKRIYDRYRRVRGWA